MKLLFIGDIIGRPGRRMIRHHLPKIVAEHQIDFCVANGENAAHGFGLTEKTARELFDSGIHLITGGNHTWDKKEIVALLGAMPVIRPLNYPAGVPGKGTWIAEIGSAKLAVINLMGHHSMGVVENPFNTILAEVARLEAEGIKHIFIDFHAETTSEKNALLKMLEGRVGAIAGTHTHIGTDDLLIARGTGYVTDVGLTGIRSEVIGMGSKEPIFRFTTGMKDNFKVPDSGPSILQAIVFDLDENGRCVDAYKIKAYDEQPHFVSLRHGGGW